MTREELLRILDFVDRSNDLSSNRTALSDCDPRWNIISYVMRRHLQGQPMTVTSIAAASDVPYGTAMRRIDQLLDDGFILKRPKTKTGKSFSIHPTDHMISEFHSFALQYKSLIGTTFGFSSPDDGEAKGFYFGGSYMGARILPTPSVMRRGIGYDRTLKILSHSDPTFKTLADFSGQLMELCGGNLEITTMSLDDLRLAIIENAQKKTSVYDIVAIDMPWVGELAENNYIMPLDEMIARHRFRFGDFHSTGWVGSSFGGSQYGIPIQTTPELLFYRTDHFAAAGLSSPETTDDTLFAARTLHRSEFGLSGIVMNYGRGTPVGHTFIQTMADFGQPIIDLAPLLRDFDDQKIERENFRPCFLTEAARNAAEYLKELLQYAHSESLSCNWDKRIEIFAKGEAAMAYGWSIRAARFELDDKSPAQGKVGFSPHPHGPNAKTVSPIGGFSLSIPANLSEARIDVAWRSIAFLTRPEMMKWYVQNGCLVSPRFSTSADPEVYARSRIITDVDEMERKGQLQRWPRPPISEFSDIVGILGEEIHDYLSSSTTPDLALANSQNRVDRLMRQHGRY